MHYMCPFPESLEEVHSWALAWPGPFNGPYHIIHQESWGDSSIFLLVTPPKSTTKYSRDRNSRSIYHTQVNIQLRTQYDSQESGKIIYITHKLMFNQGHNMTHKKQERSYITCSQPPPLSLFLTINSDQYHQSGYEKLYFRSSSPIPESSEGASLNGFWKAVWMRVWVQG